MAVISILGGYRCGSLRNLDAKIWDRIPSQDNPQIGMRHIVTNDLHKYLGVEKSGVYAWNGPCITQLQTVVEKGFTNALEVKTTKMSRGDC